jgi:hypothetical protein
MAAGRAKRAGVRELLGQVARYRRLVELGALEIEVGVLPPARRRALETLGRRMTTQQIRRLEPARRHPLMLVLLRALAIKRGDEILDLFDKPSRQAPMSQSNTESTIRASSGSYALRRSPGPRWT